MFDMNMKLALLLSFLPVYALAALDECKPIGWATREGRTGGEFSVTGGGNVVPDTVRTFTDLQKYAKDSSPRVIFIDGTLGEGWSGTSGDRLNITASNKTIIGLKPGTLLKAPIHITSKASNIIVRNIVIQGPGSNADQAWDNLTIEGEAKNIWIDHCEFWDGQDGNADVVKGADNVTFTWCIFGYKKKSTHNLSNLIGSSDNEPVSEGKLNVTYMFNWWKAANQRKPRCRYGNVHVVNNLLTGDASVTDGTTVLGVSAGHMCTVRTERNVFINENNPIYTGNANGTGVNETIDNIFTNCSGNTQGTGKSFTPPYEYKEFMLAASDVEAAVKAGAGATLEDPTKCYAGDEPVVVIPPTPDKQYQAETGKMSGAALESTNEGYHAEGYVNFDKGGSVVVGVKVDVAGEYKVEMDYANGSSEDRCLAVSAGADPVTVAFEKTGAWDVWKTQSFSISLAAGDNSLKFATLADKDGPNLDQFDVTLVKALDVAPDTSKKDSSLADSTKSDSTANDKPKQDSTAKDSTKSAIPMLSGVQLSQAIFSVKLYDTNGKLVRNEGNVSRERLNNTAGLAAGLRQGIYLVKVSATGYSRSFFVVVK
ncbi:MAG: carbohydrate-binding protein [Fibrobacter sp.]|nr:carbohydrate-binding protein [Fibrobacter sp.]